jgi:hypothetical protein
VSLTGPHFKPCPSCKQMGDHHPGGQLCVTIQENVSLREAVLVAHHEFLRIAEADWDINMARLAAEAAAGKLTRAVNMAAEKES